MTPTPTPAMLEKAKKVAQQWEDDEACPHGNVLCGLGCLEERIALALAEAVADKHQEAERLAMEYHESGCLYKKQLAEYAAALRDLEVHAPHWEREKHAPVLAKVRSEGT